jgi:hypothetical protein
LVVGAVAGLVATGLVTAATAQALRHAPDRTPVSPNATGTGSGDAAEHLRSPSAAASAAAESFVNGPINGAGFMTVVAQLPSGRLIAGGDTQGFFISDDGGRNWRSRNEIGGGADPFGSRGVASLIVANVTGPNGTTPTVFAAVGKKDAPSSSILRSDDQGETWTVDTGGKGIWFSGGNLPGGGSTRSRATSRLLAVADHGPYASNPYVMAGDMSGCVWERSLRAGSAWSRLGCLPAAGASPIRSVAVGAAGDIIVATSRMGLAGSRGGGTLPQPLLAGAWRFAKTTTCTVAPCTYVAPTAPLVLTGATSQSVEELRITPDDHLYAAMVDDRIVGQPAKIGGLWAGRPDGTPLRSVSVVGAAQLRNVVSLDMVSTSATADTVITGASLPKAATDPDQTDFEVSRVRVVWLGSVPAVQTLQPLAQDSSVDLTILGHPGVPWFVDGTSVIGNDQYVVSSVLVLRDGRYVIAGKAGLWVYNPSSGAGVKPWQPSVYGVGATFLGAVALQRGTVFATDADRFLFRADLTQADPPVRQELDQPATVSDAITKGLSVTVLPDGTAIAGEATTTFGGVILAVPPGSGPSAQLPLPVNRQPVALASVGNTVFVGIANSGLWTATWNGSGLVAWRRLTSPGAAVAASPVAPPLHFADATPRHATQATDTSVGTAPATDATTSAPPLSEPATSDSTTTAATAPPVTDLPTTAPPATEPPTQPPVTDLPTTEAPTTGPPATEPPATEPSSTDVPGTEPVTTSAATDLPTTSTSSTTTTTLPPPPLPPTTAQPFETVAAVDDVAPASATLLTVTKGGRLFLVAETADEGLWIAQYAAGTAALGWIQITAPTALPGGAAQEVAYVPGSDALFLTGISTLSRLDDPTRCVSQACPLTAVPVPVVDPAGWTPLATSYGTVPIASEGDDLYLAAGSAIDLGKPGTVYRFDPTAAADSAWTRLPDPTGVAANQLVRPLAIAVENGRLAITTSGNGLVVSS